MISLQKIDFDNLLKVVRLSVTDEQKDFVATNTESLLEAYVTLSQGHVALPFAIVEQGLPIGFVMLGYGTSGYADEPSVTQGNYNLWRFMIDQNYQGKELGRAALSVVLDYVRTLPCGKAESCWLSYEPENLVAKKLYASMGFKENGEKDGEELVAVLQL